MRIRDPESFWSWIRDGTVRIRDPQHRDRFLSKFRNLSDSYVLALWFKCIIIYYSADFGSIKNSKTKENHDNWPMRSEKNGYYAQGAKTLGSIHRKAIPWDLSVPGINNYPWIKFWAYRHSSIRQYLLDDYTPPAYSSSHDLTHSYSWDSQLGGKCIGTVLMVRSSVVLVPVLPASQ